MLRIVKLYLLIVASLLCLDSALPHSIAYAYFPRGFSNTYNNACGAVGPTQTWCVASDGWTVFSGTPSGTGTACSNDSAATYTGTCVVLVASVANGGNDSTCHAGALPAGITSNNWSTLTGSSFTPAITPCVTMAVARGKLRTGTPLSGNAYPDWLLLHRGDSWDGGINGPTSSTWTNNGKSSDEPLVVGWFGTGARPQIVKRQTSGDIYAAQTTTNNGQFQFWVGIEFYAATMDSASGDYLGATLTGDTTATVGTITNVTVPSFIQSSLGGGGWTVFASGISNQTATWSAGAPTTLSLSGAAGYTQTGLTFQIQSKAVSTGLQFTGTTNLLGIEDCYFNHSALTVTENNGVSSGISYTPQLRFRRNVFAHSYGGIFTSGQLSGGSNLIEENVFWYAGLLDYSNWVYAGTGQTHTMYLHDPGSSYTLNRNIVAYSSTSAIQLREGGKVYNNLFMNDQEAFFQSGINSSTTSTYNVIDHSVEQILGWRTATAVSTAGVAASVSFDGQTAQGATLLGNRIVNLSNPGSLPEARLGASATVSLASSSTSATSVPLNFTGTGFTTVQAGVRGDGVQVGDILQVSSIAPVAIDSAASGGLYLDNGPAGSSNGNWSAATTVTITGGAGPITAVVTDTVNRYNDEIFQFTSGTPPAGTSLSTDYCSTNVNTTSHTYNYYPATAGTCPGVSSNAITAATSASTIGRQGDRLIKVNPTTYPSTFWAGTPVPAWVQTNSTPVCVVVRDNSGGQNYFSGTNGCTTISWISPDRYSFFTNDPVSATFFGGGSTTVVFGLQNGDPSLPTQRVGPNNVIANNFAPSTFSGGALIEGQYNWGDFTQNYIYNFDSRSPASTNNLRATSPFTPANFTTGQVLLNSTFQTTYPFANVDAYDAVTTNNRFTGQLTNNGTGGAWLDVTGGGGPNVGDMLFAADQSNTVPQYAQVTSQVSSTRWAVSIATGAIGPIQMISGSHDHFIAQAILNSHANWDARWTANPANNFVRTKIKCGDQVTYPSSPACPAQ